MKAKSAQNTKQNSDKLESNWIENRKKTEIASKWLQKKPRERDKNEAAK